MRVERERIGSRSPTVGTIVPVSRDVSLRLSFAQERLWFLTQLEGPSALYNIPMARRLFGTLDGAAWRRSLDTLFARHEALRSVFVVRDGRPEVRLLDASVGLPLVVHDLRDVPDIEAQLERLRREEAQTLFDLAQGPLIRARLIRLGEHEHLFLLTMHHIVSDGWSIGVLSNELNALYSAFANGRKDPLPPLAIQYPDYAAWQREWLAGERLTSQADYWRRTLADAPVLLELPADRPRPSERDFSGAFLTLQLDAALTTALKQLAHRHGTTLFTVLLAAWAAVLARISAQHDLVIGTPSANRGRRELEALIGFFVNTLALRINLTDNPSVAELLSRARDTALAAQDHQDLPFEQVVEIIQSPRNLSHSPIFQVAFAWHHNQRLTVELPGGLQVAPATIATSGMAKFDLELVLSEWDGVVAGGLSYAIALFDAATIVRYRGYLIALLRGMVADDRQPVMQIDLLSTEERAQLLTQWNRTETPYPEHACVHQLFEEQVARTPDAVALVYDERKLSYAQLNARANRLARHLVALGVQPDDRVGLCVERSLEMVVGILAVLKAGGAYVPLDPTYPPDRLAFMLEDSAPKVVLTHAPARAALDAALGPNTASVLDLVGDARSWARRSPKNINAETLGLTSRHLAYVIYTSGSTGTPKGVLCHHTGLVNRITWIQHAYPLTPADAVLQKTPFSFDVSVWEFCWPLLSGARLVLAKPGGHKDATYLSALIADQRISVLHFVPSMLASFLDGGGDLAAPALRHIIASGESLSGSLADRVLQKTHAGLYNLYGPTEASIEVTACKAEAGHPASVPIGRPIANTRIYLLDAHGQPVPTGAVGELHIGGVGVARGYLNRPELTAERFIDSPFVAGDRLYKTGDVARYLPDGNILFLGRNDHQVKIRGFRIELGEIEARLLQYPAVREAVVVAREDQPGGSRLIAYVVYERNEQREGLEQRDTTEHDAGARAAALRLHLAASLPEYMVPAAYVALDALPLTPNGKLDRKALPAPEGDAYARIAFEAPEGEAEQTLAAIWSELLGLETVGRHDNFFEVGGHSLLAVQMSARAVERNLKLTVHDLFLAPILRDLAQRVAESSPVAATAVPARRSGVQPPVFFVPTGLGRYDYAFAFAKDIRIDCPVYAVPWPSSQVEPLPAIEEMARAMAVMIQRVQPRGPYRLAGYSSGGVLAYAIADYFLQAGEPVSFLGLLDCRLPAEKSPSSKTARESLIDLLEARDSSAALRDLSMDALVDVARNLGLVGPRARAEDVENGHHFTRALSCYRPPSLPIRLHIFHATEQSPEQTGTITLGWERVLPASALHPVPAPGSHRSIMENPSNRAELGRLFSEALRGPA